MWIINEVHFLVLTSCRCLVFYSFIFWPSKKLWKLLWQHVLHIMTLLIIFLNFQAWLNKFKCLWIWNPNITNVYIYKFKKICFNSDVVEYKKQILRLDQWLMKPTHQKFKCLQLFLILFKPQKFMPQRWFYSIYQYSWCAKNRLTTCHWFRWKKVEIAVWFIY